MANINTIIQYLKTIQDNPNDTIQFTSRIPVSRAWELNLFFQKDKDKDCYVKEKIIHEKILPYPPPVSFTLHHWQIIKEEYSSSYLEYTVSMLKEDYVDYLYHWVIMELL